MKILLTLISCSILFLSLQEAFAVPKSTECNHYQTNFCISKNKVKKAVRDLLPTTSKFVTPSLRFPVRSGTFVGFPQNTTVEPQVLIPAGTRSITVCSFTAAGKFECTVLSAYNDCPSSIQISDQSSGISYDCEVDCDNRRPNGDADDNGNCDCDILYNTCETLG